MQTLKTLLLATGLTLSSLALAEGGGDRTFARMQSTDAASTLVAQQQKAEAPVADIKLKKADHAKC